MRWEGRLRLAHELKKQLHEIMGWPGPMTHRQFLVWQAWLDKEWNVPSRSDWYAMQTAREVLCSGQDKEYRAKVSAGDFRMPFTVVRQVQESKNTADPRPAYVPLDKDGQPYLRPLTREKAEKLQQAVRIAGVQAQYAAPRNAADEQRRRMEAKRGSVANRVVPRRRPQ